MKINIAVIIASLGKREFNSKLSLGLHKICGKTILDYHIEKLKESDFQEIIIAISEEDEDLIKFCSDRNMKILISTKNETNIKDFVLTSKLISENTNVLIFDLSFPLPSNEYFEINNRIDLAKCEKTMRKVINNKLMLSGVTFIDYKSAYIDFSVKIGRDTTIYPGAIIKGETIIGEDCIIGQNTKIEDSFIGNKVEIISSVITDSSVDDGTKIGPFAYLRPNSKIGKNVKIGDFVEIKNSTISDNSKISHLAYVGDATIGNDVNIGCGVVFVNYDGENKFRSTVADGAFIGSNSNIVAPVHIAEKAYIAAGTTVCRDVSPGTLCVGRAKEKHIEGWVDRKKLLKKK
jgi:bifunctional N-acetylglucosamine-1-phosphate-uridyltransferase/glucosamine-1-phosphate-acetyltransferase GlmU-like protein